MEQFFSKSGKLLRHKVTAQGKSPVRDIVVTFYYENGESTYDGKSWTYKIY